MEKREVQIYKKQIKLPSMEDFWVWNAGLSGFVKYEVTFGNSRDNPVCRK